MSKNILQEISTKIFTLSSLIEKTQEWKKRKQKVVFTNGCFDILHRGHITYLAKAANLGDKLIIAVNSDLSVKKLEKGTNRPINKEQDRLFLLASLSFVDAVFIFEENTPLNCIKKLNPDILAKGADYDANQTDESQKDYIVGSNEMRANGGCVYSISLEEGYSTTSLVKKIQEK